MWKILKITEEQIRTMVDFPVNDIIPGSDTRHSDIIMEWSIWNP